MYFWSFVGLFLAYVSIAVVLTWLLVKLAGRFGAGWKLKTLVAGLAIAGFVLFPIWDIPLAQREFERFCQTEAGVKMMRSAEDVPGILSYSLRGKGVAEDFIKRDGYEFFEDEDTFHKFTHYNLDNDGKLVERKVDKPSSRYRLEIEYTSLKYVNKKEMFIEDMQTKEKLATQVRLTPRGGWLSQWLRWSYGDDACEPQKVSIEEFLTKTLKPSRRLHKGA